MGLLIRDEPIPGILVPATETPWSGLDPMWQWSLEAGVRSRWPGDLEMAVLAEFTWPDRMPSGVLEYRHRGLPVLGRIDPVPVVVRFHERPPYDCYGLRWHDYPQVYADIGAESPHRMGDDSLCLFFPWDPPSRRWRYENGLEQLLDIVADHLHKELWWRHTGGHDGGEWAGPDAPHGMPWHLRDRTAWRQPA